MMLDLAKLSARNLSRRGKRSWLTVIGIVIGITAIVALFSIGQGLETSITREFESLGVNTIYILPGSGLGGFIQGGGEVESDFGQSELDTIKQTQGVGVAGPQIFTRVTAEYSGEQKVIPLVGIPTDESYEFLMQSNSFNVDSGRDLRSTDRFTGLVGYNIHQGSVFSEGVGLRRQLRVNDTDIRIQGLLEQSGDPAYDRSLVLPIEAARTLLGEEERIDYVLAKTNDGTSPEKVAQEIEENLRNERNVREGEEDFTVSTADDLLESFLGILGLAQYIVAGIVSIALFVGGLGIMNTMYMSVSERTREIGIMKAIGATRIQILSIYVFEAGIIGVLGGIAGVVLGLGISELAFYFIRQFAGIPLYPSGAGFIASVALGTSFFLGAISGLLPALKAARLEPVEAIRE